MAFLHFLHEVCHYFDTGSNWRGGEGIPTLFLRQLYLSAAVVGAASVIGGGLGIVLGHTGRMSLIAVNAANAFRAVPTLALLTLLVIWPPISLRWDGFLAAFLALTVLGIPPILTNAFVGIREVDADVTDAAKAMGLTGFQVMRRVELPLAVPFIMTGIRIAAVEVVATSTLAAETFYSDLGTPVIAGLNSNQPVEATAGALLVAVMAGMVAVLMGLVLRVVTPAHLRGGGRRPRNARLGGPSSVIQIASLRGATSAEA
jgi:osmoprotectant transport system permease protein